MERYIKLPTGNIFVEYRLNKKDVWVKIRAASIEELLYLIAKKINALKMEKEK